MDQRYTHTNDPITVPSSLLVTTSNGGRSPSSAFLNCPHTLATAILDWLTNQLTSTTRTTLVMKLKLNYDRRPVGQSVLLSGSHLEPMTRFLFSNDCWFLDMGHPLWREDGFVIYCTVASGPCQSSHSWVDVPQNSRPYFFGLIWDSPSMEGRVPLFISPRNRVAQLYPPRTGFPFYPLLRLTGLRWRYSNPPPHGDTTLVFATFPRYIGSARTAQQTPLLTVLILLRVCVRCLAMAQVLLRI
jgi:hypothetical protein